MRDVASPIVKWCFFPLREWATVSHRSFSSTIPLSTLATMPPKSVVVGSMSPQVGLDDDDRESGNDDDFETESSSSGHSTPVKEAVSRPDVTAAPRLNQRQLGTTQSSGKPTTGNAEPATAKPSAGRPVAIGQPVAKRLPSDASPSTGDDSGDSFELSPPRVASSAVAVTSIQTLLNRRSSADAPSSSAAIGGKIQTPLGSARQQAAAPLAADGATLKSSPRQGDTPVVNVMPKESPRGVPSGTTTTPAAKPDAVPSTTIRSQENLLREPQAASHAPSATTITGTKTSPRDTNEATKPPRGPVANRETTPRESPRGSLSGGWNSETAADLPRGNFGATPPAARFPSASDSPRVNEMPTSSRTEVDRPTVSAPREVSASKASEDSQRGGPTVVEEGTSSGLGHPRAFSSPKSPLAADATTARSGEPPSAERSYASEHSAHSRESTRRQEEKMMQRAPDDRNRDEEKKTTSSTTTTTTKQKKNKGDRKELPLSSRAEAGEEHRAQTRSVTTTTTTAAEASKTVTEDVMKKHSSSTRMNVDRGSGGEPSSTSAPPNPPRTQPATFSTVNETPKLAAAERRVQRNGRRTTGSPVDLPELFELRGCLLRRQPTTPLPRAWHTATRTSHPNHVLLIGGMVRSHGPTHDIFMFNAVTRRFKSIAAGGDSPPAVRGHTATFVSRWPSCEGATGDGSSADDESHDSDTPHRARGRGHVVLIGGSAAVGKGVFALDVSRMSWTAIRSQNVHQREGVDAPCDIPADRSHHSAVALPDASGILVFGGVRHTGERLDSLDVFDLRSGRWTHLSGGGNSKEHKPRRGTVGPTPLSHHSAFLASSSASMIVYGGVDASGEVSDVLWALSTFGFQWSEVASPCGNRPPPLMGHSIARLSDSQPDSMLLLGGATSTTEVAAGGAEGTGGFNRHAFVLDCHSMMWRRIEFVNVVLKGSLPTQPNNLDWRGRRGACLVPLEIASGSQTIGDDEDRERSGVSPPISGVGWLSLGGNGPPLGKSSYAQVAPSLVDEAIYWSAVLPAIRQEASEAATSAATVSVVPASARPQSASSSFTHSRSARPDKPGSKRPQSASLHAAAPTPASASNAATAATAVPPSAPSGAQCEEVAVVGATSTDESFRLLARYSRFNHWQLDGAFPMPVRPKTASSGTARMESLQLTSAQQRRMADRLSRRRRGEADGSSAAEKKVAPSTAAAAAAPAAGESKIHSGAGFDASRLYYADLKRRKANRSKLLKKYGVAGPGDDDEGEGEGAGSESNGARRAKAQRPPSPGAQEAAVSSLVERLYDKAVAKHAASLERAVTKYGQLPTNTRSAPLPPKSWRELSEKLCVGHQQAHQAERLRLHGKYISDKPLSSPRKLTAEEMQNVVARLSDAPGGGGGAAKDLVLR